MNIIAGIDISKATVDVCVAGKTRSFANDLQGYRQVAKYCKAASLVVMEATGTYHLGLACYLHSRDFKVAVVNPARPCYYAKSLGLRNKTDKVDARVLAEFGRTHELELFVPPTDAELNLCRLVRLRSDLVAQRVQGKNRISDPAVTGFEGSLLAAQAAFLDEQIDQVEREIVRVLKSDEALGRACDLLTSIPGIGAVTAWSILAEVRDVRRFASAKKVAAFAGLCPSLRHSGTSLTGSGKLSRQGCRPLRKALYMAAVAAIRCSGPFEDFYERLLAQRKAKRAALVAVMHKLIRVAYGVLKGGVPFDCQPGLTPS